MGAIVATLLTKSLLVQVSVIAMPRQEIASVVDCHGLVDVRGHKVIKASPDALGQVRRGLARLGLQTLYGIDVGKLLISAQSTPDREANLSVSRKSYRLLTSRAARGGKKKGRVV